MNLLDKLQDTLLPLAQKLDNNKYLAAIKNGFFAAMPLLIIGSIFLLITQIPIKPYLDFMAKVLGDDWMNYFLKVNSMAMDIMSLWYYVNKTERINLEFNQNQCIDDNVYCFS